MDLNQPDALRNTFGEIGMFDMPSARMAPDGQIAFTYGDVGHQQRFSLAFQALPWLEASFRYSHVVGLYPGYNEDHLYDRSFGLKVRLSREGDVVPEVSVGIRDLLGTGVFGAEYVAASKRLGPFNVTAGLGWGGLAERSTFSNPLGLAFSSFKTRSNNYGVGGTPSLGLFFRGANTAAFGGVTWETPIKNLDVVAEYSAMEYRDYVFRGGIHARSPVNMGLAYRAYQSVALKAAWMYGDTFGFTVSLMGDPTTNYPSAIRIGPDVPPPALRTDNQQVSALSALKLAKQNVAQGIRPGHPFVRVSTPDQAARTALLQTLMSEGRGIRDVEVQSGSVLVDAHVLGNREAQCTQYAKIAMATGGDFHTIALTDLQDPRGEVTFCASPARADQAKPMAAAPPNADAAELAKKLRVDLAIQDVQFAGLRLETSEVWLYYESYRYRTATEVAGRVVRVLLSDMPPSVEILHLVPCRLGLPQQQITVFRSGMERALASPDPAASVREAVAVHPAPLRSAGFGAFDEDRYPQFSYAVDPKLTQHVFDPDHPIQFMIYADAPILLQLMPGLDLSARFTGQIWSNYTYDRDAGSALPHVRSDILKYLKHGKYGLAQLDISYRSRLSPTVFTQVRAGYLEDMFFGAGGQVLWRPDEARFAVGADLYQVWQRAYNRLLGLRNYKVTTGHVSVYYRSDWQGLNYAVHAGRYLAGDYGATFEVTRRFESGVEVGAWATFTDVPFNKFGEGSFDKGIIVHIPLEWGLPIWTQSSYDLRLNSLTRDGGQRLAADDSLYDSTSGTSYGEIVDHISEIAAP